MRSKAGWMVAAAVLATVAWVGRGTAQPGGSLPGARPVIDAALYGSLQAALDAVPEEGGLVLLPAGEFELREPLVVTRSDVTIQGAGTATHLKNVNTEGAPAIVLRHPSGRDERNQDRWRVSLARFRVTGNPQSGNGIEARRINELLIDGVTVSYHGGDGILLHECYEDPRICDSLVTYNKGTGLALIGCHDIVVSSNQFEENQDAVHCFDGYNLCMTGNCLDDHLGHGVVIENTYGSVVSGNMIEECQGMAVIMDRDCYGNTVSANVIAHNFSGGVDLRDAHGCAISANTFTLDKRHGVRIGPASGRITVSANNFCDSEVGAGPLRKGANANEEELNAAAGLLIEGASEIAVSGNLFAGVRPGALTLAGDGARRVLFANNVLTDVDSDDAKLVDSVSTDNLGR